MITAQEIFDKVVERSKDKRKSEDGDNCMYRAPDGLKCFAGVLLPDDEYDPKEEGVRFGLLRCEGKPVLAELLQHKRLINEMQNIHDNHPVDMWPRGLRELAEREGLVYRE